MLLIQVQRVVEVDCLMMMMPVRRRVFLFLS
jgi:hypothetical protein